VDLLIPKKVEVSSPPPRNDVVKAYLGKTTGSCDPSRC
jgi:hypothetical protein